MIMEKATKLFGYVIIINVLLWTVNAQGPANNWLFGQKGWVRFKPGPAGVSSSAMATVEGSSSISDNSGNLLFYTDGRTAWNKNHVPMLNGKGLLGDSSSTQSALIVPCTCTRYFIFATDSTENGYVKGLTYSVVDMSLGSGLGDVISGRKNISLLPMASEKLTAVSDGQNGFWVLAHAIGNNRFFAYHIIAGRDCEASFEGKTVVVSDVGSSYSGGTGKYGSGQMKFSPDGTKVAVAGLDYGTTSFVELFAFNTVTGKVSDFGPQTVRDVTGDMFYGIEFSPSGKGLYVTSIYNSNKLFQYDISLNTLTTKNLVKTFVSTSMPAYEVGALQLAPDSKIYIARPFGAGGRPYLSGIMDPDTLASSGFPAGFVNNAVSLSSGTVSRLGLPAMISGDFSCTSPLDPCCPPWSTKLLGDVMSYRGSASAYTLEFVPSDALNKSMQAYINYLHAVNPAITAIIIDFRLHDQGAGATPNPPYGPQIPDTAFVSWNSGGTGSPTIWPVGFFNVPPTPPHPMAFDTWYTVHTGIFLNDRQKFFPDKCAVVEIPFRIPHPIPGTRDQPPAPVLEISDGKNVIRRIPLEREWKK
jgi:hypothetical protein